MAQKMRAVSLLGPAATLASLGVHSDGMKPLVTHRYKLDQIEEAHDRFGHQRDGVLKVAITN